MNSRDEGDSKHTVRSESNRERVVVPSSALQPVDRAPILEGDELARAILLKAKSREELYAKITSGDPLRLVERSSLRVREQNYLMEGARVANHTALVIAAIPFDAHESLGDWLNARIDDAIEDVLIEDQRREKEPHSYTDEDYEFMLLTFGIVPERCIGATVRFNGLNDPTRKSFFDLLVYHKSIAQCIESGLGPLELLRYRCQLAMYALLQTKPKRVDLSVNLDPIPHKIRP